MPILFLFEAEYKSFNRFPTEISSEDLNRFFLLSDRELIVLKQQLRAEHNRLGFALQLCCLRYLGFFPEELQLPERVIKYVAQQLRSGDIYILQSRRFSELETYFIPQKEWSLHRDEVVNLTGTPIDVKVRLAERESELVTLMGQVEELLNQSDSDLREERGKLVLSPIKADEKTLELKPFDFRYYCSFAQN